MHLHFPILVALLALLDPVIAAKKYPKDSILLSSVKSLTLRANARTSHRRVPAVPQLVCEGPGCKHHTVDVMRCMNSGSDYEAEDIQWSCTASLPEEFKLASTEVVCEGYESSQDERVLKGSCGVVYRLVLTDKGEEKYGGSWWGAKDRKKGGQQEPTDYGGYLFGVLFVAVAAWILYSMFMAWRAGPTTNRPRAPRAPRAGAGWGGGGGGGDDDPFDPPPPYPGTGKKSSSTRQAGESWRPGFWSGALGGAAAGYAAGRSGGNAARDYPRNNGGGWFGGGNSGGNSWGSTPSRSGSSSSSSSRYESTGFGSTTRR